MYLSWSTNINLVDSDSAADLGSVRSRCSGNSTRSLKTLSSSTTPLTRETTLPLLGDKETLNNHEVQVQQMVCRCSAVWWKECLLNQMWDQNDQIKVHIHENNNVVICITLQRIKVIHCYVCVCVSLFRNHCQWRLEALTWRLTLGPTAPGTPPSPEIPCTEKRDLFPLHLNMWVVKLILLVSVKIQQFIL